MMEIYFKDEKSQSRKASKYVLHFDFRFLRS